MLDKRFNNFWLVLLCGMILSGCSKDVAQIEKEEREQPALRKAATIAETGNSAEAISLFYKALEKNPSWAKAHLELALLYHDIDQVSAIYHYRRYLNLRPETEKREMIEGRIQAAELVMISDAMSRMEQGKTGVQSAGVGDLKKVAENAHSLNDRIISLEKENAELRRNASKLDAEPIVYKVQAGDTLSGIADRIYKDKQKWKFIYDANKEELAGMQSLKVGQTLVIPVLDGSVVKAN